jgi:hypothetical protein
MAENNYYTSTGNPMESYSNDFRQGYNPIAGGNFQEENSLGRSSQGGNYTAPPESAPYYQKSLDLWSNANALNDANRNNALLQAKQMYDMALQNEWNKYGTGTSQESIIEWNKRLTGQRGSNIQSSNSGVSYQNQADRKAAAKTGGAIAAGPSNATGYNSSIMSNVAIPDAPVITMPALDEATIRKYTTLFSNPGVAEARRTGSQMMASYSGSPNAIRKYLAAPAVANAISGTISNAVKQAMAAALNVAQGQQQLNYNTQLANANLIAQRNKTIADLVAKGYSVNGYGQEGIPSGVNTAEATVSPYYSTMYG